jgi:hypothetical protein
MCFGKSIALLALAGAIATYAVDCSAMNTPEQAMNCCGTMPCPPRHGNSEECCKAMPSVQAPFMQPPSMHGISYSPVIVAVLTLFDASHGIGSSGRPIVEHSHAPRIMYSPTPPPLRI